MTVKRAGVIKMIDWKKWVAALDMAEHPEGGYYKETYRCPESVLGMRLSKTCEGDRSLATSILFLLPSDEVSEFHRLKSDELWYFHAGSPLTVYIIDPAGELHIEKLGLDFETGERPQIMIPAGSIFGALVPEAASYTLVSCVVTPGFDFCDFELLPRKQLLREYPQYKELIMRMTKV
jgi:predicted cupin superfamily sugar epimerase